MRCHKFWLLIITVIKVEHAPYKMFVSILSVVSANVGVLCVVITLVRVWGEKGLDKPHMERVRSDFIASREVEPGI